jgi:hypothetical protein
LARQKYAKRIFAAVVYPTRELTREFDFHAESCQLARNGTSFAQSVTSDFCGFPLFLGPITADNVSQTASPVEVWQGKEK